MFSRYLMNHYILSKIKIYSLRKQNQLKRKFSLNISESTRYVLNNLLSKTNHNFICFRFSSNRCLEHTVKKSSDSSSEISSYISNQNSILVNREYSHNNLDQNSIMVDIFVDKKVLSENKNSVSESILNDKLTIMEKCLSRNHNKEINFGDIFSNKKEVEDKSYSIDSLKEIGSVDIERLLGDK